MELFCTPKSSMENPSLRVNRHGGSTSKTLIVEGYAEDEFGQRATDEVTGEQGYFGDERSCFLDMGRHRVHLAVQTIQEQPSKKKRQEKERKRKSKGGFKRTGRVFLVKNKHRIQNCGKK